MEAEYSLFVEENSLPRGHVPFPCLLDGGYILVTYISKVFAWLISGDIAVS